MPIPSRPKPIPEPATNEQKLEILKDIMRTNRVDAWDLGFQRQLSPGDYDKGLLEYLARFGWDQTVMIVRSLSKVRK